ncbi:MAG: hypothetical protein IJX97_03715 [Clostridia bacterium]|nr:hypothetical protein [Clostridia bacterium]MBQ8720290.1 hypothetical protein [Clostridia bacterium]
MWPFKKKSNGVKNGEDRELIDRNYKLVEALIVLSSDEELTEQLGDVKEKLKYLTPSENPKVYDADKKITNAIQDMKILLTKEAVPKAKTALKELLVLVAERNSLV